MAIFREPDLVKFSELFSVNFDELRHKGVGLAALRSPIGLRLIRTKGVRLDSGKVAGWMPI